jgi:hypothetical protein
MRINPLVKPTEVGALLAKRDDKTAVARLLAIPCADRNCCVCINWHFAD